MDQSHKDLPKLQYIQRIYVNEELAETYQQFLRKLITAHKDLAIDKTWTVYENVFTTIEDTREFIFVRALESYADLDKISSEEPLTQVLIDNFGEQQGLQWMKIAQRSITKITTEVISKIPELSLE